LFSGDGMTAEIPAFPMLCGAKSGIKKPAIKKACFYDANAKSGFCILCFIAEGRHKPL